VVQRGLRDGNQALIEPMDRVRKRRMVRQCWLKIGFKEIEVGFPAPSPNRFRFCQAIDRTRIDSGRCGHPSAHPSTPELIARPMNRCAARGAHHACLYSTSVAQRRVCSAPRHVLESSTLPFEAPPWCANMPEAARYGMDLRIQPGEFTGTELDFAVEVCDAVNAVWEPTRIGSPLLNFRPRSNATPNIYADQIEWFFAQSLKNRAQYLERAPAQRPRPQWPPAGEFAVMAGAERVEGTLFGNGERTGMWTW